jgi:acetyl-CoA carboxylase carboxyl transferase subunit alpha
VARHPDRPGTADYVKMIFDDFVELHGDRQFRDDAAMMCGLGTLGGERLMLIGHRKGHTTKERQRCNWGCAHPEGYRKAMLKMRLAEKLGLPIVTFVDTPGAYPGIGAEERGIAQAIAENMHGMSQMRVPILCVVIGEGSSGGALGIGLADRICMLEHAYYSVIGPEGCAAILFRTRDKREDAALALKLTSYDVRSMGIADEIVPEPVGGAHRDHREMGVRVKEAVLRNIKQLKEIPTEELLEKRYARYRAIGRLLEGQPARG